jgi:hypothetical protein
MLKQNATISLEPQFDPKSKEVTGHILKIEGELLSSSEMEHHVLKAIFDSSPKTCLESSDDNGKLTYRVTFLTRSNILPMAQANHDDEVAARNKNMTLKDYRAWKAEEAAKATE